MTVTTLAAHTVAHAHLRHRKSVTKLTHAQLTALRQAFAEMQQLGDERGFQHWAGLHGLPLPMYCQHHTDLFLPWHRAYLYFFELAMRDRVPIASLPWWDWSAAAAHRLGIPAAYA